MTLAELHERIGWQLEGRLQIRQDRGGPQPDWLDWSSSNISCPALYEDKDIYRRRPDPPPMPDEVWLPKYGCLREKGIYWTGGTCYLNRDACSKSNESATPVRYIRVGAIIPASQMEVRRVGYGWEPTVQVNEYRIKP